MAWVDGRLNSLNISQHGKATTYNAYTSSVSGYKVVQIRERGLSAIHRLCGEADDKADAPPCGRLQYFHIIMAQSSGYCHEICILSIYDEQAIFRPCKIAKKLKMKTGEKFCAHK